MDPTEILRFKKLQQARLESIARTVFYGLQIIYGMFWYVSYRAGPQVTDLTAAAAATFACDPHILVGNCWNRMVSAIVSSAKSQKRSKRA